MGFIKKIVDEILGKVKEHEKRIAILEEELQSLKIILSADISSKT